MKDFVYKIRLITIAITIISIVLMIIMQLSSLLVLSAIIAEAVVWVILKIQDIKINLLYSINEKLEKNTEETK